MSGATLDRPALERLRDAMRAAPVRCDHLLLAGSVAAGSVNSMVLVQECRKYGVKLIVRQRLLRLPRRRDVVWRAVAVAQYEWKKFADRSRRGRKQIAREGFVPPQQPYATVTCLERDCLTAIDPRPSGVMVRPMCGSHIRVLRFRSRALRECDRQGSEKPDQPG